MTWPAEMSAQGAGAATSTERFCVHANLSGTEHRLPQRRENGIVTTCSVSSPLLGVRILFVAEVRVQSPGSTTRKELNSECIYHSLDILASDLPDPVCQYSWEHKCAPPRSKLSKPSCNQLLRQCYLSTGNSPLEPGFAQF